MKTEMKYFEPSIVFSTSLFLLRSLMRAATLLARTTRGGQHFRWPVSMVFAALLFTACNGQTPANSPSSTISGTMRPTAALHQARAAHTATLLHDGSVLVAGGFVTGGEAIDDAEVFNNGESRFDRVGKMGSRRSAHTATLLPSGKVLIAGGFNGSYLDTAEIYDPATKKFTPAAKMTMARSSHNAVLLQNGKVLLFGGVGTGWTFLSSAEIYDPATGRFEPTGSMANARESHTATLLPDGRVVTTGGHFGRRAAMKVYRDVEIYDPAKGSFEPAGEMTVKRHKHDAVLLNDGRILIVGGTDERDRGGEGAYDSVEIFDPAAKRSAAAGTMKSKRYKLQGTTTVLPDGKILIAGGSDRPEIFDPVSKSFAAFATTFGRTKLFATATPLGSGRILITGGYDEQIRAADQAWIFEV